VLIHGVAVPVERHSAASPALDLARCVASKPFADWAAGLEPGLQVRRVLVSSVDFFGPRVGFLKVEAEASFNGLRVPGIAFLRGGAVSILVVLHCEGERFVVCTRQPRVPVGRASLLELPAGMLDDSGAFAGVAAKELAEETGIRLGAADLVDLTARALGLEEADGLAAGCAGAAAPAPLPAGGSAASTAAAAAPATAAAATAADEAAARELRARDPPARGMYPSAGGCDEFIRLMFHERTVTRAELDEMRGKATGCLEEGEVIVLEIVRYDLLWRVCSDAKALSSLLLFERLRAAGQI